MKRWFLSQDLKVATYFWHRRFLIRSTIVSCKMILIRRVTLNGFISESRTLGQVTQSNSIYWTTQRATPCSTTEWRSQFIARRKPTLKIWAGTAAAQTFHTLKTQSKRNRPSISTFTRWPLLIHLIIQMTQSSFHTVTPTRIQIWITTLQLLNKTRWEKNSSNVVLSARHLQASIASFLPLPVRIRRRTRNLKRV